MSNVVSLPRDTKEPDTILLDNNQAAKFLGLSVSTINKDRCVRNIGIPFVKMGRAVRYRQSDLIQFVNSRVVA